MGAAVLAVVVNLCAAGGISVAAVALALWTMLALALNLREDRPEARRRPVAGGRISAFATGAVWAALMGTYYGQVFPYLRCQRAIEAAEQVMEARQPDYECAAAFYDDAKAADVYSARPWFGMAEVEYLAWSVREEEGGLALRKIPIEMFKGVELPRPDDDWARHAQCEEMMTVLLHDLGTTLDPKTLTTYRGNIVKATRKASLLYPTNASLCARLAEASADVNMINDAIKEGRAALELDAKTPHLDKKLNPKVRIRLKEKLPVWERADKDAQEVAQPKKKAAPQ